MNTVHALLLAYGGPVISVSELAELGINKSKKRNRFDIEP